MLCGHRQDCWTCDEEFLRMRLPPCVLMDSSCGISAGSTLGLAAATMAGTCRQSSMLMATGVRARLMRFHAGNACPEGTMVDVSSRPHTIPHDSACPQHTAHDTSPHITLCNITSKDSAYLLKGTLHGDASREGHPAIPPLLTRNKYGASRGTNI